MRSSYFLPSLSERQIDLGKQALEGALEGLRLDIFEGCLQRVEQFSILRAGQIGDAGPEVIRLDDIMHLAAHLLLEIGHVIRIVGIPDGQRHTAVVALDLRIIPPQFFLRGRLVIVRQVAQEEERQHVIAEIVRVHRAAQVVGNAPKGLAQLCFGLGRSWMLWVCWVCSVAGVADGSRVNG